MEKFKSCYLYKHFKSAIFVIGILVYLQQGQAVKGADDGSKKHVAVIGGGISGVFAAKYLADYDPECKIGSITIFDPFSFNQEEDNIEKSKNEDGSSSLFPRVTPITHNEDEVGQGARVSSITLSDGTVVELGASIIFSGNRLVVEMTKNDHSLVMKEPYSPGKVKALEEEGKFKPNGFGIYNGNQEWSFITANMTSDARTRAMLWRYNLDLWRVSKATDKCLDSFESIYDLLNSTHPDTFFKSPDHLWDAVGLLDTARSSFEDYLDSIGISGDAIPWWRSWLLSDQGSFRREFLDAANIVNNNQNNTQMTALAGLVNFVASKGDLFSIQGGNGQIINSAFHQATTIRQNACGSDSTDSKIKHIQKRVSTVVGALEEGIELFASKGEKLGRFDIVILAAPMQFTGINFLVRGSLFDNDVLHPMPLNGMVDAESSDANEHSHMNAIKVVPESASRPYTQVITSVVSNAKIDRSYFGLKDDGDSIPTSILFTVNGKKDTGLSSISQLTSDGVYKAFSSEELSQSTITRIFGPNAKLEYSKVWGKKSGGATPAFDGGGESTISPQFLLYDSAHGVEGYTDGGALYYTNGMEASVSALEICAIGAKAVSKLVAHRLKLIVPSEDDIVGEL